MYFFLTPDQFPFHDNRRRKIFSSNLWHRDRDDVKRAISAEVQGKFEKFINLYFIYILINTAITYKLWKLLHKIFYHSLSSSEIRICRLYAKIGLYMINPLDSKLIFLLPSSLVIIWWVITINCRPSSFNCLTHLWKVIFKF